MPTTTPTAAVTPEPVLLVHGIWMTGLELLPLSRTLKHEGFAPRLFHYPSLRCSPAENADRLHHWIRRLSPERLHLVGHSLGGIVLVHLFARHGDIPPGRAVLLGTPLQGSRIARRVHRWPILRILLGRSTSQGLLGDLPPWRGGRPVGMIAGVKGFGIGSMLGGLPRPHDGTVALDETRADWLTDHQEVPRSHFGMLLDSQVHRQVARFLEQGRFDHRENRDGRGYTMPRSEQEHSR